MFIRYCYQAIPSLEFTLFTLMMFKNEYLWFHYHLINHTTFGILAPSSMYFWGFFKKFTNSIISVLASSHPATSLQQDNISEGLQENTKTYNLRKTCQNTYIGLNILRYYVCILHMYIIYQSMK